MELKEIQFGNADARTEADRNPRLLLEAFYDSSIADKIWQDDHFLAFAT